MPRIFMNKNKNWNHIAESCLTIDSYFDQSNIKSILKLLIE